MNEKLEIMGEIWEAKKKTKSLYFLCVVAALIAVCEIYALATGIFAIGPGACAVLVLEAFFVIYACNQFMKEKKPVIYVLDFGKEGMKISTEEDQGIPIMPVVWTIAYDNITECEYRKREKAFTVKGVVMEQRFTKKGNTLDPLAERKKEKVTIYFSTPNDMSAIRKIEATIPVELAIVDADYA